MFSRIVCCFGACLWRAWCQWRWWWWSHPRLVTGTLYRSVDNITTMKRAWEVLLSMAPKGFSSCYNYTNNYKRGTLQAVRHLASKDVSADLSCLRSPVVLQLVINLHRTTLNVNLVVPFSPAVCCHVQRFEGLILVDSSPVQRPVHSWSKKRFYPITHGTNHAQMMTFLFLNPMFNNSQVTRL